VLPDVLKAQEGLRSKVRYKALIKIVVHLRFMASTFIIISTRVACGRKIDACGVSTFVGQSIS